MKNLIGNGEIVETPWALDFLSELVTFVETIEFIHFINVIQIRVDFLTAGILLEYLITPLLGLTVLDENPGGLAVLLVHVVGRGGPVEQEVWLPGVVAATVLDLVSVHPGVAVELLLLLVDAAVLSHLGDVGFVDEPLGVFFGSKIFES